LTTIRNCAGSANGHFTTHRWSRFIFLPLLRFFERIGFEGDPLDVMQRTPLISWSGPNSMQIADVAFIITKLPVATWLVSGPATCQTC
jgi:hypothetical protein